MEPVSTVLTGLALAKSAIGFIKENLETLDDAKAIGEQLANIFRGHKEFNKERYGGSGPSIKNVAIQKIEYQQQQEALYELKMLLDLRFGHGFYDGVLKEFQDQERAFKEEQKKKNIRRIQQHKQNVQILQGVSLAMGIVIGLAAVIWFIFTK